MAYHLNLPGIPQIVMRLRVLKLPERVQMFALIAGMLCNRSLRPGFGALRRIVLRRITNKVNRELTPYDQLIEVAVARRF